MGEEGREESRLSVAPAEGDADWAGLREALRAAGQRPSVSSWTDLQRPPHAEPVRSKVLARIGGLIAILATVGYLTWRVLATMPHDGVARVAGWMLFAMEAAPLIPLLIRLGTLWTLDNPVPPRAGPDQDYGPAVILIPTLNEPVTILAPTIAASVDLQPAHETWVLDDGDRPWVAELCAAYGARYVQREVHDHAKAGNVNNALRLLREEGHPAEFIAVLDCDHVPLPGFLTETLGWFDREEIALVQAPQAFYNAGSFDSDGFAGEQGIFFHVLLVARDPRRSDPYWCGSTSVLRRSALEDVGGVATQTITEDFHTTLKLLRRGWRAIYHHQILAIGIAPETPAHFLTQRRRWALGAMQMLLGERLWWPKRWLSWRNHLEYLTSILWWFEGALTVGSLLVPAVALIAGIAVSRADVAVYAVLFATQLTLRVWGAGRLFRGYTRFWHSLELRVMRIPIGLACLWWLITRRQVRFDVTPKGASDQDRRQARPPRVLYILVIVLALVLAYGAIALAAPLPWHTSKIAILTAGVWVLWGEIVLMLGIRRIRDPQYSPSRRRAFRFQVPSTVEVDGVRGLVNDISVTGASVTFPSRVPTSSTVDVVLPGARPVTMSRVSGSGQVVAYGVDESDLEGMRTLSRWIFHTPPHEGHAIPAGMPAAALVGATKPVPASGPGSPEEVLVRGTAASRAKRLDIQGLRAIAVLLVMAAHLGVPGLGGGFVGVDVFFVISGFLITGLLAREYAATARVSFLDFYCRRALRILPAAGAVTVAILVCSGLTDSTLVLRRNITDAIWSSVFLENVHLAKEATDYFANSDASPFQHFWSLSVEEQFYLLWPVLALVLFGAVRRRLFVLVASLLTLVALIASIRMTHTAPDAAYFNAGVRSFELGIGAVLALMVPVIAFPRWLTRIGAVVGLALIGISAHAMTSTDWPGWHALAPTLGAALVIAGGLSEARGVSRLLGILPLTWIGDISYSLYLWHWPVIVFGATLLPAGWSGLERGAVEVAISLACAQLSYSLVEQPVLRRGRSTFRPPRALILWPAVFATLLAAAFGATQAAELHWKHIAANAKSWYAAHQAALCGNQPQQSSAPARIHVVQRQLTCATALAQAGAPAPYQFTAADLAANSWDKAGCWFFAHPATDTCMAPAGYRLTIAAIGDSHMGQWLPALKIIANRYHARLVPFITTGCSPMSLPADRPASDDNGQTNVGPCPQARADFRAQLKDLHPDLLLVGGLMSQDIVDPSSSHGQIWRDAVAAALPVLRSYAGTTVLFADVPLRNVNVPTCLGDPGASLDGCSQPLTPAASAIATYLQTAATQAGLGFVNTLPLVCTDTYCPAAADGLGLFSDASHISAGWSTHVEPALEQLLRPYLKAAGD